MLKKKYNKLFKNMRPVTHKPLTGIEPVFGFNEREMNNPLTLCELAARAPNISVGHMVKQAWLPNDRVCILVFYFHALMQGALDDSNSANRHWIAHFALSMDKTES